MGYPMEERRGQRREEEEEEDEKLSERDESGEMALVGMDGQVHDRVRCFGVAAVIPGTRLDTMARLKNEAHISSLAATSSLGRAWLADSAESQGSPPS